METRKDQHTTPSETNTMMNTQSHQHRSRTPEPLHQRRGVKLFLFIATRPPDGGLDTERFRVLNWNHETANARRRKA